MASLSLSPDELRAVESSRQRLSQLSNSIASLKADVFTSNPLPALESLQASADILRLNLNNLYEIASQNNELFSRVAVHPSTNYPGRTQEGVLLQLLRKKPEPEVAALMDQGRQAAAGLTPPGPNSEPAEQEGKSELEGIWSAASEICRNRIRDYVVEESDDPFTAAERETGIDNVRTGLRRKLEDDDDEDEDEEDKTGQSAGTGATAGDPMMVDRPPPPPAPGVVPQEVQGATLENILRFAARGEFVAG